MREGAVGFGHAVRIFALLHRVAAIVRRVAQLARQPRRHRVLGAGTRRRDQPADRQRLGAFGAHFHRDLIGRTANAARTDFDARLDVVERVVEHAERVLLGARLDGFHRRIDDAFRDRLLAVQHDAVHELRQDLITKLGIWQDFPLFGTTTTSHFLFLVVLQRGPEPGTRSKYYFDGYPRPALTLAGLLGTLSAVLRTRLAAILDTLRIEHAAQDVVANAGKVAHAAATDQHHRVLLKVVAFARNVADDFAAVGQADLGHLAQRRVRLLRGRGIDASADAALLRVLFHRRDLRLGLLRVAALADQLVDRWHEALHLSVTRNLAVTLPGAFGKNEKGRWAPLGTSHDTRLPAAIRPHHTALSRCSGRAYSL